MIIILSVCLFLVYLYHCYSRITSLAKHIYHLSKCKLAITEEFMQSAIESDQFMKCLNENTNELEAIAKVTHLQDEIKIEVEPYNKVKVSSLIFVRKQYQSKFDVSYSKFKIFQKQIEDFDEKLNSINWFKTTCYTLFGLYKPKELEFSYV